MFKARQAVSGDYRPCTLIDRSYTTNHVWQVARQFEGEDAAITFRAVRLPRPVTVKDDEPADQQISRWLRADAFFVVEDEVPIGYLALDVDADRGAAHVREVVVQPERRRRGVGRLLLGEARQWSRAQGLQILLAETQTRNFPAIRFFLTNGFTFCGYNECAYPTRDIAVYLAFST